ncbi:tetratricopeptide repeat protein [Azospirillum picis]|uniref:Flp pilus assembly protein TadD n=1 Tax=Azospirillum picis TaxID=488438 RepID=A0ABU0MTM6_9PROT|nr:tetratricopeptide repeat protein [Azospirillum picis]MBP2303071.1 Flp pilus assembly protein TadD [Azospirillum picis]MDQ0536815.1 Flp pilus assembly protein TadD [Azospirillum picis]
MSPPLPQSPFSAAAPLAAARRWFQMGDRQQAAQLCQRLLAASPDEGEALHLLGLIALGDGHAACAASLFAHAAAVCPGHAQAHANRAAALHRLGRSGDALAACRRALALQPAEPVLLHNMAALLRECGRGAMAITAFRRLVRLAPHNGAGFHGLLDALRTSGELTEAVAAGRALVALHPALPATHGNLGILLQFQGCPDAAMRCYTRALTLDPEYAEARSNLGLAQLLTGDLAQGWSNYAARWQAAGNSAAAAADLRSALPVWDGGPLGGRRLLAWGELGVGDEILLAGMIPDLEERGIACVLEAAPRLVPLFARSFPRVEVVPRREPPHPPAWPDDLGAQCALGNLGRWLRPDFGAFPRRSHYLNADPHRTSALRARYRAMAGGNRLVGISWHSANPLHRDFKSAPLILWAPVLRLPGITFVDLQYGDRSAELEAVRRDQGVPIIHDDSIDPLSDLDGFAAQVAALDLVISISNTTVHVAGALGVPVWTLLARQTGFLWCWFTGREDSPWYPSMRLYRQGRVGDWGPVFERVCRDLRDRPAAFTGEPLR